MKIVRTKTVINAGIVTLCLAACSYLLAQTNTNPTNPRGQSAPRTNQRAAPPNTNLNAPAVSPLPTSGAQTRPSSNISPVPNISPRPNISAMPNISPVQNISPMPNLSAMPNISPRSNISIAPGTGPAAGIAPGTGPAASIAPGTGSAVNISGTRGVGSTSLATPILTATPTPTP